MTGTVVDCSRRISGLGAVGQALLPGRPDLCYTCADAERARTVIEEGYGCGCLSEVRAYAAGAADSLFHPLQKVPRTFPP